MKRQSSSSHGFSLLELLIVVVILGLISGIALPNLLANWEDERLNASSKITSAWLDELRRKAIQQSSPCRATWDLVEVSLRAQCDNETTTSAILNLKDEIADSQGLFVSLRGSDPTTLVFTPRGTSTTESVAFFALNGSSDPGRCLRVSAPLGLIRTAKRRSGGVCDYTTRY